VSIVNYHIAGGLDQEQIEKIHDTALRLLENVGGKVTNPKILAAMSSVQGAKRDGQILYLKADLIQILSGYAFKNLDFETGAFKPMDTDTCIETAKLVDCFHKYGVRGGTPGLPQDVPPQLRDITAFRIGCEYSRSADVTAVSSPIAGDYIYRMAKLTGIPFHFDVFVLSPLRIESETLDLVFDFAEKDYDFTIGINAMPMLGLSTPVFLPAAFVENVASILATLTILKSMNIDREIYIQFTVYPFDLKYGTIAYGTPEHILCYLMGAQINRYYGNKEITCKAFHTNSRFPDGHSVAQRASFASIAALNGARHFTYGGLLGIDTVFSAEQLLIDVEIISHLRELNNGVKFSGETLGYDILKEVGHNDDFLTHISTLMNCKKTFSSELFDNNPHTSSGPELKERVKQRLRAISSRYDFSPDSHVKKELNALYDAAKKQLGC